MRQKVAKTIVDYLKKFRIMKSRCFTQVPENKLVELDARGIVYSITKKLDT